MTGQRQLRQFILSRRSFLLASGATAAMLVQAPSVLRAQARKKINLAIHWIPRGDFCAYYLALERGYYAQAGMDVSIQHLLGNGAALQALSAGTAQLIHADLTQMLQVQGKSPEPLMRSLAIATNKTGTTLFFKNGHGISKPKDLEGHSIVDSAGSTARALFTLVAKANKIDESKVVWKTAAGNAKVALMLQGEADAVATGLWARVGILTKLKADELGQFPFGDWGANIHGDGVISTQKLISEDRALVKGFVQATLRGYKEGFADPDAAADAIRKHHIELKKDSVVAEFKITRDLAIGPPQKAHGIGYHDPAAMKATYDFVVTGLNQPISRPVTDLYTNDFIG